MALIRNYELQGMGIDVPNAYHIITHMDVEKRNTNSVKPCVNYNVNKPNPDDEWEIGFYGRIVIQVWKDQQSKDEGLQPLGNINYYYNVNPVFKIDPTSTSTYLEQAYAHLRKTIYYSTAIDA